jgi:hypothetical protein
VNGLVKKTEKMVQKLFPKQSPMGLELHKNFEREKFSDISGSRGDKYEDDCLQDVA